jgi:ABC-2 type transport system ATP-binding protein
VSSIEVVGLSKRFGDRTAVEGLTFQVEQGEVFGLLGPNGAGKTTTVRMLSGLLSPTAGNATVGGLSIRTGGELLRKKVGLLTENPGLYDRLTGRENLLFFIKLNELEPRPAWERAASLLRRFGLEGREEDPCGSYSKGMRQKLAVIRAIIHQPEILFLDEPTSGLDPQAARTVRDAVAQLAQEGTTIVLCSHNLSEVEQLCSRVAVIRGQLIQVSSLEAMRRAELVLEVRLAGAPAQFQAVVSALPFAPAVELANGALRVRLREEEQAAEVISALVLAGARIYSASRAERPLEQVYLDLMRRGEAS